MKLESYDTGANSPKAYQEKLLIYVESQVLTRSSRSVIPFPMNLKLFFEQYSISKSSPLI